MERDLLSTLPMILGGILALAFLVACIWSIIWAFGDAEKRGKSGCLVALMVFFLSFPAGLIIWLLIRPSDTERREEEHAAEQ